MTRPLPFAIEHPIILAPMAGVSTAAMAAAVTDAGGLGSIALGALGADAAAAAIAEVRALTSGPVACNVFAHAPCRADEGRERAWLAQLAPAFEGYGRSPPETLSAPYASFVEDDALLEVLLAARVDVVSVHFGLPREDQVRALHENGTVLLGCATSVPEACALEAAGIDAIVVQGVEAGGHRGCFDAKQDAELPLEALLRQVLAATECPIIAAGGLMDGKDLARVLGAGASAGQFGTAFVGCPESAASDRHRALLRAQDASTALTRAISGRPARGFVNGWFDAKLAGAVSPPDYPVAYAAGKALAAASAAADDGRFDVCWAGTGAGRSRALPARELVAALARECVEASA